MATIRTAMGIIQYLFFSTTRKSIISVFVLTVMVLSIVFGMFRDSTVEGISLFIILVAIGFITGVVSWTVSRLWRWNKSLTLKGTLFTIWVPTFAIFAQNFALSQSLYSERLIPAWQVQLMFPAFLALGLFSGLLIERIIANRTFIMNNLKWLVLWAITVLGWYLFSNEYFIMNLLLDILGFLFNTLLIIVIKQTNTVGSIVHYIQVRAAADAFKLIMIIVISCVSVLGSILAISTWGWLGCLVPVFLILALISKFLFEIPWSHLLMIVFTIAFVIVGTITVFNLTYVT